MLVLSRHAGESFVIQRTDGTDIEVVVVQIRGDKVRLGVVAQPEEKVLRRELLERAEEAIDTNRG
jgi:carbon storage regulator